jgi:hypothetical protein
MIINDNELKAAEGFTLTNGQAFGKTITLSPIDSVFNWHEITDKEAEEMQTAELEEEYKMLGDV